MSGHLVGSPAFKAGGTGDPRPAGSIPVHLRQSTAFFGGGGAISIRVPRMKKLILLIVLVALGAVAAKKIKAT